MRREESEFVIKANGFKNAQELRRTPRDEFRRFFEFFKDFLRQNEGFLVIFTCISVDREIDSSDLINRFLDFTRRKFHKCWTKKVTFLAEGKCETFDKIAQS